MLNKFDEALSGLLDEFAKFPEILVVYLYGSVARGDFSLRHSDIDLFIVVNKKSVARQLADKIDKRLIAAASRLGVGLHIEYQPLTVKQQDHSLIQKVVEEGKLIYASGVWAVSGRTIGLRRFKLLGYSTKSSDQRVRSKLSQILKGRTVNGRMYKGIIDGETIIDGGKGALLVEMKRLKDVERVFTKFGVKPKTKRLVFA